MDILLDGLIIVRARKVRGGQIISGETRLKALWLSVFFVLTE